MTAISVSVHEKWDEEKGSGQRSAPKVLSK